MHDELAALVMARCDELATISAEAGQLTRPAYTAALREAQDRVADWMRAAGMTVYEDAVGNLVGSYPADRSAARTLLLGSHLDTVRDAGRYDGVLGVLVGIAAVEALRRQGRRLACALEVIAFADEEGLRFGCSYTGSLALVGHLEAEALARRDADGVSLGAAISAFGGDPELIAQDVRRPADLLGYLELHIEQGPLLEARGQPLGLVTAIAGATRASLSLSGAAGHAGTVPMDLRRDALCGAAELILATEALARATPGLVATIGQVALSPGASNVIPAAVTLSLDLRHQDDGVRLAALAELQARAASIVATRGLSLAWEELQSRAAVAMAPALRERLARALSAAGYPPLELASGAGHDAAVLAIHTDAAMLFVRCRGGISHNPAEAVEQADVAAALAVLGKLFDAL